MIRRVLEMLLWVQRRRQLYIQWIFFLNNKPISYIEATKVCDQSQIALSCFAVKEVVNNILCVMYIKYFGSFPGKVNWPI